MGRINFSVKGLGSTETFHVLGNGWTYAEAVSGEYKLSGFLPTTPEEWEAFIGPIQPKEE